MSYFYTYLGCTRTGDAILAAQAMGADFGYIGSAFIATHEANATDAYKQAIVDHNSDEIVYSNLFTGVHGNYLAPSIRASGLDPANLPEGNLKDMDFSTSNEDGSQLKVKPWRDIWGCGQGLNAIKTTTSVDELVNRLEREYIAARKRLVL